MSTSAITGHQIEHHDLSYKAYHQLKAMILQGELIPGEKIRQEHIAAVLGISRMPLHKAFQMLEHELLVESIPRRGIYVKKIDFQEIADAFDCREAIEGIACQRLAETATKAELDILAGLFEPFKGISGKIDPLKYQEADHLFHSLLIEFTGNKILQRMEVLGNVLIRSYTQGLIRPPEITLSEHFDIIDALRARDGDLAEKLIRRHSSLSRKIVLEQAGGR